MATEPQVRFIKNLLRTRWAGLGMDSFDAGFAGVPLGSMDTKQTSAFIDRLKKCPEDADPAMPPHVAESRTKGPNDSPGDCETCGWLVPRHEGYFHGPFPTGSKWRVSHQVGACNSEPAPAKVEVTEGIYTGPDGEIVKAYLTRNNRIGGKVWENGKFRYVKGALALARNGHKLTAAEAAAFGHDTGRCVFCAMELTDARSVTVGYGPKCATNHDLPWG